MLFWCFESFLLSFVLFQPPTTCRARSQPTPAFMRVVRVELTCHFALASSGIRRMRSVCHTLPNTNERATTKSANAANAATAATARYPPAAALQRCIDINLFLVRPLYFFRSQLYFSFLFVLLVTFWFVCLVFFLLFLLFFVDFLVMHHCQCFAWCALLLSIAVTAPIVVVVVGSVGGIKDADFVVVISFIFSIALAVVVIIMFTLMLLPCCSCCCCCMASELIGLRAVAVCVQPRVINTISSTKWQTDAWLQRSVSGSRTQLFVCMCMYVYLWLHVLFAARHRCLYVPAVCSSPVLLGNAGVRTHLAGRFDRCFYASRVFAAKSYIKFVCLLLSRYTAIAALYVL